jgi:hypothetical protein
MLGSVTSASADAKLDMDDKGLWLRMCGTLPPHLHALAH